MEASPQSQQLADLYRRYGPAIHRRALALVKEAEEAVDITQDTFLAYMRGEASLRGEASAFTVLYQIATHKAVDRLRRKARWTGSLALREEDEEEAEQRLEAATAHEGDVHRVEAAQDLALLTQGEEPQVLTAAFLYHVEGYSTEEVAQTLDLSRKTVSKLLVRFTERARKRSARFEPEVGR
jgi:RNA polymerase sigma-70 factor (ECF subfamily)